MPLGAKADFLSSLFGFDAQANTNILNPNSQSIPLLQANVSSALVMEEKENKKAEVDLNKDVNIVADNALLPNANPLNPEGIDVDNGDPFSDQISVYVVRKGDSIAQIAEMFKVSTNTILWANDMKKGEKLVEGDVLLILPVSGIKHTVLKGQTLKGIAKKYNVEVSDIARFNGITEDSQLAVGDELIVPDGEIVDGAQTKKNTKSSTQNSNYYKKYAGKDLGGYFTNPVPQYVRRSQGIHGKNGVDLAAPTGTPIVAAAGGKVLLARMGWNGAYGNMVIISHPNGTQTLYGHMSKLGTRTGASVSKGDIIGYVGSTGRSTGPHLHFEVHGASNPTVSLSKR